ncbi:MAG: transposase, partial [Nitrospiria bacterium]
MRIEFPGAVYHLTSRGNARQNIYRDDADRETFLTSLSHVVDRFSWRCYAYCLMDNHYHLLIETPKPNLSRGMRQLNGIYTQSYNRRHRKVGHLLQGRFKSILVEKETHFLELCRYVVLNPVRAKRVKHPSKWLWSSYRATVGESAIPDYLSVNWLLAQFGRTDPTSRKRYRAFVAEGIGHPGPWDKVQGQIYLGGEAFVKKHQPNRKIKEV